jgi:DnaK suppressor protein
MPSNPSSEQASLLSYGMKKYTLDKKEEYMCDDQLSHFRQLLLSWKSSLLKGGDETIFDLQSAVENTADVSDQATQEENFALRLRTRDRESKLLKKIEESIVLISHRQYGFCDECGVDIGIRRLEARPTATLCIDCKTLDEVREKNGR